MAAALLPRESTDQVGSSTRTALCMLGRRVLALDAEKDELDDMLGHLEKRRPPSCSAASASASTRRPRSSSPPATTPGDPLRRAWAHLCGVAPIQASSGKVTRVRLDRGGDRQANSALWVIVMARMSADKATRAYVERRLAEGRSQARGDQGLEALRGPEALPLPNQGLKPPQRRAWPIIGWRPKRVAFRTICRPAAVCQKPAHAAEPLSPSKSLPSRVARPCPAWPSRLRQPERTPELGPDRYRTGIFLITARAEMGSVTSWDLPGHRHIVRLCGPGEVWSWPAA